MLISLETPDESSLVDHLITREYRTKMLDWMLEVCFSFRCQERTWFLAAELFDQYLMKKRGQHILSNHDVHSIGVQALFQASKYEDIYAITSHSASEKISHNVISVGEIKRRESHFVKLFDFQFEFLTAYDICVTALTILEQELPLMADFFPKLRMRALYILRTIL